MRASVVVQPGLEAVLLEELRARGVRMDERAREPGVVAVEVAPPTIPDLVRALRTPSGLHVELARGRVASADQLVGLLRTVRWVDWLSPVAKVEVEVSTRGSRLRFRDVLCKQARAVIAACLKVPRIPERERRPRLEQRVLLRLLDDTCTVMLDAAGEALHRRGWRQEQGKASLRENLAAALVRLSGWDDGVALYDPFCGAGTIPIEAALLAAGRSPHGRRGFACDEWPCTGWRGGDREGRDLAAAGTAQIVGSDKEGRAVAMAEGNARRAGVRVRWRACDVGEMEAVCPVGVVVCNPPYGERLGNSVEGVYRALGASMRARFQGWSAMVLSPAPELARTMDRRARRVAAFSNGGIRVGAYAVDF
jgi:putative N6-adenine-specific DNA methylase